VGGVALLIYKQFPNLRICHFNAYGVLTEQQYYFWPHPRGAGIDLREPYGGR